MMNKTMVMKPGTQNQNVVIGFSDVQATNFDWEPLTAMVIADFNTNGACSYFREGASADVDVTAVTGVLGTWTSGGFLLIDDTNMPGMYQFGIPNAALAHGAKWVDFLFFLDPANLSVPLNLHIILARSLAF